VPETTVYFYTDDDGKVVPNADILRALERMKRYARNPEKHTYEESLHEQA
jgi:hypothetical protein